MVNFLGVMGYYQDLWDYTRRYPNLLPSEEVGPLSQYEWVRYCREQLWIRIAKEKFNKSFGELSEH